MLVPAALLDAAHLNAKGYALCRGIGSIAAFRGAAQRLGPIIHETTVELRPGAKTYLANPEPIPPHTDHPAARVIGWFCEEQDPEGGAMDLVDGFALLDHLGSKADRLANVHLPCPALDSIVPSEPWPMLRERDGRADLYFAPWREPRADASPELQEAYQHFRRLTEQPPSGVGVGIRLAPGDALFIDNRRILHGRNAIAPDSPRRLKRVWVGD